MSGGSAELVTTADQYTPVMLERASHAAAATPPPRLLMPPPHYAMLRHDAKRR